MEKIKFSVLIPVYNNEEYLAECVNSVLIQNYDNFEIIIVDDGSDDKTAEICDSFSDGRIKVFHNENCGPLLTRVFAVSKATGDYCVFIDGDDYVDNGYFKRLSSIISEENCDMVVCPFRRVDNGRVSELITSWNERKIFKGESLKEFQKELLFCPYLNSMCIKIVRTSILKADATDFNEFAQCRNGEDLVQSLYPVFNSEKIVYIPESWYHYRVNNASITHTTNPYKYKSVLSVRKRAYRYLEQSNFFDEEIQRKYFGLIIKIAVDCVKMIALSEIDRTKKNKAFEEISKDELYCMAAADYDSYCLNEKEKILYKMFRQKMYGLIVTIMKAIPNG